MATKLMKEPCSGSCFEEAEFLVSFVVTSLEMTDEDEDELFNNVLIVATWDGNVVKLTNTKGHDAKEFNESLDWLIHSTPDDFSKKLVNCPMMLNLSRGCQELGTIQLPISSCFADAVLCDDFNSQTITLEFDFVNEENENAKMQAYFRIHKLLNDGISGKFHESIRSQKAKRRKQLEKQKKKIKTNRKASAIRDENSTESSDEDSEEQPCDDFLCPDELPEHCKKNFGLDEAVYRIVNGNLINIRDKTGPCGEKCPVARKHIKDLCKATHDERKISTRYQFEDSFPKCHEIFDCSHLNQMNLKCPGQKNQNDLRCADDWIDRNIKEEDLLEELCKKYEINVDDVRALGKEEALNVCEDEHKKKQKVRKPCKAGKALKSERKEKFDECFQPSTKQEKVVKLVKCKTRGRYSYDFGNTYPLHRSCLKIEQGAGDAIVPKYIGWRWDEPILGIEEKKWHPGQINKTVECLMKCFLKEFPKDNVPVTRRDKHGRIEKTCTDFSKLPLFDASLTQKPLLQIRKNDSEYCITMKPLKDSKRLGTSINPFLDCSPLTFTIRKHPEDIKKHKAKKILNELGFNKKCNCLNLKLCRCKGESEKRLLSHELKRISEHMHLEKKLSFVDLEDSSDSEMNVEFMTPSAMIDTRKLKSPVVHCGTQYSSKDLSSARCQQMAEDRNFKSFRVFKSGEKEVRSSVRARNKVASNTAKTSKSKATLLPGKPKPESRANVPKKPSVKLLKAPLKVSKVKFETNLPLCKLTGRNAN